MGSCGAGCVVAVGGAVRASGFRDGVVMLICGGWVPQDLVSSHVRCLETSAAAGGRLLIARSAELVVRECREAQAAPPAGSYSPTARIASAGSAYISILVSFPSRRVHTIAMVSPTRSPPAFDRPLWRVIATT